MTKLINNFLDPAFLFSTFSLCVSIYLMMLAKGKQRKIWLVVSVFIGGMYVLLIPFVTRGLEDIYSASQVTMQEVSQDIDCYVVLSSGLMPRKERFDRVYPDSRMTERLLHFTTLYYSNPKPVILTGGKTRPNEPSEAEKMREVLLEWGVQDKDIILEDQALNTYENAKFSCEIIMKRSFQMPLVITDRVHMKRSALCFKKFTKTFKTSVPANLDSDEPAPYSLASNLFVSSGSFLIFNSLVHECCGLVYYFITGKI